MAGRKRKRKNSYSFTIIDKINKIKRNYTSLSQDDLSEKIEPFSDEDVPATSKCYSSDHSSGEISWSSQDENILNTPFRLQTSFKNSKNNNATSRIRLSYEPKGRSKPISNCADIRNSTNRQEQHPKAHSIEFNNKNTLKDVNYIHNQSNNNSNNYNNVQAEGSLSPILHFRKRSNKKNIKNTKSDTKNFDLLLKTFNEPKSSQVSIDSCESKAQSLNRTISNLSDHISSISTNDDVTSNSDSKVCSINFENRLSNLSPVRKRRKKHLPGSLMHRFRQLIKRQESIVKIWNHELYKAKHCNFQIPKTSGQVLHLKILNFYDEYGMFFINCIDEHTKQFRLMVNCLTVKKIEFKVGSNINVYKPFIILDMKDCEDFSLVVNVCKYQIFDNDA